MTSSHPLEDAVRLCVGLRIAHLCIENDVEVDAIYMQSFQEIIILEKWII